MRKVVLFVFIFSALALFQSNTQLYAQPHEQSYEQESIGTVLSYRINPASPKTGEKSFIRIKIADNLASSDTSVISIKNDQWLHIDDIRINHNENEILIWFIPLDPATAFFPEFMIEDKTYSGISLPVQSRLGNEPLLNPLGEKVLLPWTRVLFAGLFTLLVLVLFLIYYAIKVVPGKIRKTVVLKTNAFKRKSLLRKMAKMVSSSSRYEKTDYIKRFIRLLKEYLEIATRKKTTCFTTGEIITAFPQSPSGELILMDTVRFGNSSDYTDPEIITKASGAVYSFALMLEETMPEKAAEKAGAKT